MRRRALALLGLAALPISLLAACGSPELAAEPPRVVFFEGDSAALSDDAKAVVDDAAALARRNPTAVVRVVGFADPEGGAAYNRALSAARAENVKNELIERGVASTRVVVSARGPTAFDMVPIESRRVEIRVGMSQN